MNFKYTLLLAVSVISNSLYAQDLNAFEDKEIGWKTKLPVSWTVIPTEAKDQSEERTVLLLKKGQLNSFTAIVTKGEWEGSNDPLTYQSLADNYQKNGVEFEGRNQGEIQIDGLKFKAYSFDIYTKDRSLITMHQTIYTRILRAQYYLVLTVNSNSDQSKKEVSEILTNSKFSLRE